VWRDSPPAAELLGENARLSADLATSVTLVTAGLHHTHANREDKP